ncbi:MAG: decaprenyl-phosphate phosphoribosyltransferase [Akkermansia sp.]
MAFSLNMFSDWCRALRVRHYIKNALLAAAPACSGQLFEPAVASALLWGLAAFCTTASLIYLLNDLRDCEQDRLHPTKRNRPLASGRISRRAAWVAAAMLAAMAMGANAMVFHPGATAILLLYVLLNFAYSFGWKNIPILDITILSSGFIFRVLYGAWLTGIVISDWLYLTIGAFAFCMALGKRRNELQRQKNGNTRKVLRRYNTRFLDKNLYVCLGLTNVFYALWCTDATTAAHYGTTHLPSTVPLVLLITMKYSYHIEGDSEGDPVEVLLRDKVLLLMVGGFLMLMFALLYCR